MDDSDQKNDSSQQQRQISLFSKAFDHGESRQQQRQQSLGQIRNNTTAQMVNMITFDRKDLTFDSRSSHQVRHKSQVFDTDYSRRNFSSAKARLNTVTSPSPEMYIVDPVYIKDMLPLPPSSEEGQKVQRERISNAIKRPKDIFDPISKKPIQIASYVLGKQLDKGRTKNPAKTRTTPNIPKAVSRSVNKSKSQATLHGPNKSNSKSPKHQSSTNLAAKTKNCTFQPRRESVQRNFANLAKKQQKLPGAFTPARDSSTNNQSTLPKIYLSGEATDLDIVETPKLAPVLTQQQPQQPSVQIKKMAKTAGNSLTNSISGLEKIVKTVSFNHRTSEAFAYSANETIDLDFFKRNQVKGFDDKHHVEKVLDRAFPSAEKEEKAMEKLIKSQTIVDTQMLETDGESNFILPQQQSFGDNQDLQVFEQAAQQTFAQNFHTEDQTTSPQFRSTVKFSQKHKNGSSSMIKSVSVQAIQRNFQDSQPITDAIQSIRLQATPKGNSRQRNQIQDKFRSEKPPKAIKAAFRLKKSPPGIQSDALTQSQILPSMSQEIMTDQSLALQLQLFQSKSPTKEAIYTDETKQAFLTEPSMDQQQTHPVNYNAIIQAQKLARLLDIRSQSSVTGLMTNNQKNDEGQVASKNKMVVRRAESMPRQLKQTTAAVFNKDQQIAQVVPKEFIQQVDQELRKESLKRMEQIKKSHSEAFEQINECGLRKSLERSKSEMQVSRTQGRQLTPFTQNVKAMNFFSIFVNSSVDEQNETAKLAQQQTNTTVENLNKDDKELHLPSLSITEQISMQVQSLPKPIEHQDHKDEKSLRQKPQNSQQPLQYQSQSTCPCNSLTNEMIKQLVLESPIKNLVEEIHTFQLFNHEKKQGKTAGVAHQPSSDPLKVALDDQQQNGSSQYSVNQRTDVSVLNVLLNQILTGKYTFDKSQIFTSEEGDTKVKQIDRFLKGINYKGMLSEVHKKILKQQELQVAIVEEPDDEIDREDFFFLNTIKEKQEELAILLETRKMPEDKQKPRGVEAATFLTQVFKESEFTQKELEKKFPNWAQKRNIQELSQEIINKHATSAKNVAHQKRIQTAKLKKEREVKELFDQIHNIAQESQKTAVRFFEDQTRLTPSEQANNAGKEQLLYLAFLEIVRQVSGQCKEQSLFLVKLWHAYFDHFQEQMKSTLTSTSAQTHKISSLLGTMSQKFAKVLVIDEQKDLEFLSLIDKHNKALQLIELVSKSLYQEREQTKRLQLELDTLKDNFSDILPNYEKYYTNSELRNRLMKYTILAETDAWSSSERQQLHMTPYIKKCMEEQLERDKFQAAIVKDFYRIQSVTNMRLPVDYALENAKEAFQKSAVALKMKEVYYKNLQERAQRLKRQNEDLIKRIQDMAEQHEIQLIQREFEAKERIQAAVKKFRTEQLRNILSNTKEVQTDHELIEKYFADLENQKELGIRAMMITRKLTSVQMQQLRVVKAFEKQPKFKHLTKPIVHIMRTVRDNRSQYPAKTLKKTLEMIAELVQERLNLFNEPTDNFKIDYLNLDHFYSKFMNNKYGIDHLAQKYTEQWLVSIKAHAERDNRVNLFMRFMGLGGYHSLPFSVFTYYLHLLKATNVEIEHAFKKMEPDEDITLSYQKVMFGYKDLIAKTNVFNRRNVMTELRQAGVIHANNPTILKELSFSMFETYRYTVEKLLKSQRYRSFSDLLSVLFERHSLAMEQAKKKKPQKRGRGKKGLKRGQTVSLSKKSGSLLDIKNNTSADVDNSGSQDVSQINISTQEDPLKTPKKKELDVIDELNLPESEVKASKVSKIGLDNYDVRAADQAEEEKDFINLTNMVNFMCQELHLNRPSDHARLRDLLEVILISAQGANPDRIGRYSALRCFTEKIEIQISLSAYLQIGINAKIDDENSENMWLEKVFNFYSQLKPDNYKASSGMDPDHRLIFTGEMSYDGLEFVQFYIFCKDGGSKHRKDKVTVFQIYEDECSQKNRQRLSCDDFIELIRKFKLIKNKLMFENNMRVRYDQAKTKSVYVDTQSKGTQIQRLDPEWIQQRESEEQIKLQNQKQRKHPQQLPDMANPTNIVITDYESLKNSSDDNNTTEANDRMNQESLGIDWNNNRKLRRELRDNSFDRDFENSKTPYRTHSQLSGVIQNTQSRLSVMSKVKLNNKDNGVEDDQAQQFVATNLQDGSLQMSPEPHLGPTMLEMGQVTSSSHFHKVSHDFKLENKMLTDDGSHAALSTIARDTQFRPPSPILHQTENSRIIDQEVQETIERINKQLAMPPVKHKKVKHQKKQKVQETQTPLPTILAGGTTERAGEEMIEKAVDTLNWREKTNDGQLLAPEEETFVLSRADTMKVHQISQVNLQGYLQNNREYNDKEYAAEEIKKQDDYNKLIEGNQEIGFLELMFGDHNMKLKNLNFEAKQYVEGEQSSKSKTMPKESRISTLMVNVDGPQAKMTEIDLSLPQEPVSAITKSQISPFLQDGMIDRVEENNQESLLSSSLMSMVEDDTVQIELLDNSNVSPGTRAAYTTLGKTQTPLSVNVGQGVQEVLTGQNKETKSKSPLVKSRRKTDGALASGISEWPKEVRTEVSIGMNSVDADDEEDDQSPLSQYKYQEVESRKSGRSKSGRSRKSLSAIKEKREKSKDEKKQQQPKKGKKKKKKTTKQTKHERSPSQPVSKKTISVPNDDIGGVFGQSEEKEMTEVNNSEERKGKEVMLNLQIQPNNNASPEDSNKISYFEQTNIFDRDSSITPAVDLSSKSKSKQRQAFSSKNQSFNNILDSSASGVRLVSLIEDSALEREEMKQLEEEETLTLTINESKLAAAIMQDAEQHPNDFNFGNTQPPPQPKTNEELRIERLKQREELLKMIKQERELRARERDYTNQFMVDKYADNQEEVQIEKDDFAPVYFRSLSDREESQEDQQLSDDGGAPDKETK